MNLRRLFIKLLLVVNVLGFSTSLFANEQDDLKTHFLEELNDIIKIIEDPKLSKTERNSKIVAELTPMIDFKLMAKLSLGKKQWMKLSKEDQVKFVNLYVERMKNSYSSKIDSYENEEVKVTGVIRKKNRISLETEIATVEKNLKVAYKFYKPKKRKANKDIWLIYDVEIIGISILKADKAQFKEFLRTKSIYDLMDALSKQTNK